MEFSDRLRELRTAAKMSQTALGDAIGITIKQIQRYEMGTSEPTLSKLIALADVFGVSIDYLAGRSDVPTTKKRKG